MTRDEQIFKLHQHMIQLAEAIRKLCEKNDIADIICVDVLDDLTGWEFDWED